MGGVDRCVEYTSVFACHSVFVWAIKAIIPVIASVGSFFLARALTTQRQEGCFGSREARFWIAVILSEILHFCQSFLPFERESITVAYMHELATAFVCLTCSAQMIVFMRKSFGHVASWARIAVIVMKCAGILVATVVIISFWADPDPSPYARQLAKPVHTFELAARAVFVWATCVGFVNDRRFDWNFRMKVRYAMRVVMFVFALLSMVWTAMVFCLDMFTPNMLKLWLLLDSRRRQAYLLISGLMEFLTGDLCVVLAGVCFEVVLWAEHKETDRVVNNEAAMNSIMTNIVLE